MSEKLVREIDSSGRWAVRSEEPGTQVDHFHVMKAQTLQHVLEAVLSLE